MTAPYLAPPRLPCPVCGFVLDGGPAPCPSCGLPAAGRAAVVVSRIGATLTELGRDRDALLASLAAAAPRTAHRAPAPAWAPPTTRPAGPAAPPNTQRVDPAPRPPRRRISPQQVLLGLGAVLIVAAALAFVAVAWSRFGVVFQAGVLLLATTTACAVSGWTARRGLRATEEALAAAGAALLAVDLGATRALGLFGLQELAWRTWWTIAFAVLLTAGLLLRRVTPSTTTWPLVALLAAQPLPFLLLPVDLLAGPAGVAVALALAAGDLAVSTRIRRGLALPAGALGTLAGGAGVVTGLATAYDGTAAESWTASLLLAAAGIAAVVTAGSARAPRALARPLAVAGAAGPVVGWALLGSLGTAGDGGPVGAGFAAAVLLTAAVLLARRPVAAVGLAATGAALAVGSYGWLFLSDRSGGLAITLLAATVPAALAAVRLPALRQPAAAAALLAPAAAVLTASAGGDLPAPVAGLLLALLAATAFGLAAVRAARPEEWVLAAVGGLAGLAAGATTGAVGAWGQVGLQLAIAGAAAGCYAVVSHRRAVAALAVTDLVVASWIAVGGAGVDTPEAFTLPAALGLLLVALPHLRAGASSWAAEGAAAAVALAPSAMVVVAEPTAVRLVLVVAGACALTVLGTLTHRQAPFAIGAASLALVALARLSPYADLLPRWLTLAAAGLLLLVVGATYERRRQQAREALAWVVQMR